MDSKGFLRFVGPRHRRRRTTASHVLVKLVGQGPQGAEVRNIHRAQYCAIHRTSRYELYCVSASRANEGLEDGNFFSNNFWFVCWFFFLGGRRGEPVFFLWSIPSARCFKFVAWSHFTYSWLSQPPRWRLWTADLQRVCPSFGKRMACLGGCRGQTGWLHMICAVTFWDILLSLVGLVSVVGGLQYSFIDSWKQLQRKFLWVFFDFLSGDPDPLNHAVQTIHNT